MVKLSYQLIEQLNKGGITSRKQIKKGKYFLAYL